MNLWLRLLALAASVLFRRRLSLPGDASVLAMAVLPNDIDLNGHVNNGRLSTIMDLGCLDLVARSALRPAVLRNGWRPIIASAQVRYKRQMGMFASFRLETRILHWEGSTLVIGQEVTRRGKVVASAMVRGGLYCPARKGFVPMREAFLAVGIDATSPVASDAVLRFLASEGARGAAAREAGLTAGTVPA